MFDMFETMQKFSQRTGLSYWAIRKLAMNDLLPYVKVGNRFMINVELALAALASMSEKTGA